MKVSVDGDRVAVETGKEDKELANAVGEVLSGVNEFAHLIGVDVCEWCEKRGRLRPYQLTVDGEFKVLDICAECQRDFVGQAADAERADDEMGETVEELQDTVENASHDMDGTVEGRLDD